MRFSTISSIVLASAIAPALAQDTTIGGCYDQVAAELFFGPDADSINFSGSELAAFVTELEANQGRFNVPIDGVDLKAKHQAGVESGDFPITPTQFCMDK
jgi:hypothetical protein